MEIEGNTPIVLFDNQCYICTKFAKFINLFAKGKIMMIGHYSDFGLKIRNEILDEFALDMFWFIDKKIASGGRAALYPLVKSMLSKNIKKSKTVKIDEKCQQDCKTIKAVFIRSTSLLTNSRQIDLKKS
ncbi:MAG: hypothetical protein GKS07_05365 [Nitrosopumilus sp.]|nr:MAG: hypothetical protein GKS07_05365 [Nitrosopumilus sp.]